MSVALVAHASAATRDALAGALGRRGLVAVAAASGHDAIDTLSTRSFDLVLIGSELGDMRGLDLCEWLTATDRLTAPPVVLLVDPPDRADDRVLALRRGVAARLVLPVADDELHATVDALLDLAGARQRADRLARTLVALHRSSLEVHAARSVDRFVDAALSGAREIFDGDAAILLVDAPSRATSGTVVAHGEWTPMRWDPKLARTDLAAVRELVANGAIALCPTDNVAPVPPAETASLLVPFHSGRGALSGCLAIERREVLDDDWTIAAQYALVLGVGYENLRSVARARSLAVLGRRMSESSTAGEVASGVMELAPAVIGATFVALALVNEFDPGRLDLVLPPDVPASMADRYVQFSIDEDFGPCVAVRDARVVVHDDTTTPGGRRPAHERFGLRTTASAPLVRGANAPFGAVVAAWDRAVTVDEDIVERLTAVADITARGVDRAHAADARVERSRRTAALATFAQALATARTVAEVQDIVGRLCAPALGGASAALFPGTTAESPVTAADPAGRALFAELQRRGAAGLLTDGTAHFVGRGDGLGDEGERGFALVPLPTVGSTADVVAAVIWRHRVRFDETMRAEITTVAQLIGQTVERARLYDAEHTVVGDFHRRALQPIPTMRGVVAEARYQPAGQIDRIGGDFFDGVVLDEHRLAVIVGDITGHGLSASAQMVQIRTKLHTLLSIGTPLDVLLRQADRALATEPEMIFGTAVVAIVDTSRDVVEYVSAGHPPLLLRHPDGAIDVRFDGRRSLLGVPGGAVAPGRARFVEGSSLLAYTDGLVERIDEGIDDGIDRLARAFGRAADLDDLLAALTGDRARRDDIALVQVTRVN